MTLIKRMGVVALAGVTVVLVVGCAAEPETPAGNETSAAAETSPASGPQMPMFAYDPTWPKMPLPDNWALGNVVGVDVDPQDHIWINHRPSTILHNYEDGLEHDPPTAECCRMAPPVIEIDFEGNVVQAWGGPGEGYVWPENAIEDMHNPPLGRVSQSWNGEHTVYLDHNDNVWLANSGATNDAHILKFSRTGEFLLMVGRPGKGDGSNDTTALGKPTGIVVDPETNEVFVADGYTNRRVIVFDADTGEYRRHWGAYGNRPDDSVREPYVPGGPPSSQFRTPHGLNMSHDGLIYLADRGNCRIQVFQKDGTFVDEVIVAPNTPQGSAFDIAFSADDEQEFLYMLDGRSGKVRILRRRDLTHLGDFGHGGRFAGGLTTPHNLAVDSRGNLYITESGEGKRVQRFLYKGLGPVS